MMYCQQTKIEEGEKREKNPAWNVMDKCINLVLDCHVYVLRKYFYDFCDDEDEIRNLSIVGTFLHPTSLVLQGYLKFVPLYATFSRT